MNKDIAILWKQEQLEGQISVKNGTMRSSSTHEGENKNQEKFTVTSSTKPRLERTLQDINLTNTPHATIVSIKTNRHAFSFFLRDVRKDYPVYIPSYEVIITEAKDQRTYEEIENDINNKSQVTALEKIRLEPEENYEQAASQTLDLPYQTWLGLSRDMRIFGLGYRGVGADKKEERLWDWIQPRYHGHEVTLPENDHQPVSYHYMVGRGVGGVQDISRRLDKGYLPILHTHIVDDDIHYHSTNFVSYEKSELTQESLRGTHYLVADGHGHGHMMTGQQKEEYNQLLDQELNKEEESVFYCRIEAVNQSHVPRYAWFKNVIPNGDVHSVNTKYSFESQTGFSHYDSDRVFCISKLNGNPLSQEENAILVYPGETVTFEFYLPHRPIPRERAEQLFLQNYDQKLHQCRNFWEDKLESAAQIRVPEKRIEEMIKAGLLHLDLVTYGLEPDNTVVPTIGVYTAIGSESAPIIQFMDSMGWNHLARRSNMYFLDKQHEDGFIQNFGGYMLETGAALWSMGEHYRYTRDNEWVKENKSRLIKSYEYIKQWRNRNLVDELKGKGYGMLEGKVADPEDPYHSYMLNGYAYIGLARLSEMLSEIDPSLSQKIKNEAEELKGDIRQSFFESMERSPVVPLGDGSWCPTAPPWAEYQGPLSLFAEGGNWFTHGTVVARDSIIGPTWLVPQEVLAPEEEGVDFLLDYHSDLMYTQQVAFSQPYYSPHPWIHLKRGEIKPFLKSFYNGFAGLADRETYTFWEHYWHASPHKTHEEGWFLMQVRWMLYMEEENSLNLFKGIPRNWLEDGQEIHLKRVATYFGPMSVSLRSEVEQGKVYVKVSCDTDRKPQTVSIRVPHPLGQKPFHVKGGEYNELNETIVINHFEGQAEVSLDYRPNR